MGSCEARRMEGVGYHIVNGGRARGREKRFIFASLFRGDQEMMAEFRVVAKC